jgi:hypothetical protein
MKTRDLLSSESVAEALRERRVYVPVPGAINELHRDLFRQLVRLPFPGACIGCGGEGVFYGGGPGGCMDRPPVSGTCPGCNGTGQRPRRRAVA